MTREGSPRVDLEAVANLRVGVISALWHRSVVENLLHGARQALIDVGVTDPVEIIVPGTFELPVVARELARSGFDASVALGVVIRGETAHFDYICNAVSNGLIEVSIRNGMPIGFGILTCDTLEQAQARARWPGAQENKGFEAALAAITAKTEIDRKLGSWEKLQ